MYTRRCLNCFSKEKYSELKGVLIRKIKQHLKNVQLVSVFFLRGLPIKK